MPPVALIFKTAPFLCAGCFIRPNLLYGEGLIVERSEWANDLLLRDLRSDENMEWVPDNGWFTYLKLETERRTSPTTYPSASAPHLRPLSMPGS